MPSVASSAPQGRAVCHLGSGQCHNVFIITDVWTCVEGGGGGGADAPSRTFSQFAMWSVLDLDEVCSEDQWKRDETEVMLCVNMCIYR